MKHLALVTDAWHPQINGVVTAMQTFVGYAEEHGWKVTVIHPGLFRTVQLPWYREINIAINPWKLSSLLPDDITNMHVVTEGPLGWAARVLCSFRGWQFTTGFHTNFPEYLKMRAGIPAWLTYPIFRWFHRASRAIFVPSKSTSEKLQAKGFRNLVVCGRGFNGQIFSPSRRRHDLLDPAKINLLYVGRVSQEKNIDAFLQLAANPEHRLWVVGDGPDRQRLEQTGKATFVGFKRGADLAEYFASADVFVFPSRTDTLGIVSIEAMACGTPVAAYDVEGPRDVVTHGEGGVLGADLAALIPQAIALRGQAAVLHNARRHTWAGAVAIFYGNLVPLLAKDVTL